MESENIDEQQGMLGEFCTQCDTLTSFCTTWAQSSRPAQSLPKLLYICFNKISCRKASFSKPKIKQLNVWAGIKNLNTNLELSFTIKIIHKSSRVIELLSCKPFVLENLCSFLDIFLLFILCWLSKVHKTSY